MYYPIRRIGRHNNWFQGTCWCEELVKKRFRRTGWCKNWFQKLVVDESDTKSDPSIATHTTNKISATYTTNGISTWKLYPLFINQAIQAVVRPITLLVTVEVKVAQESLSPCQKSLPQANVTENVIGTGRDRATPRDASSSKTRYRASCGSPSFVVTFVYQTWIGNKDIFSPSNSSTARRGRNANPSDASIMD